LWRAEQATMAAGLAEAAMDTSKGVPPPTMPCSGRAEQRHDALLASSPRAADGKRWA
jgi:hypothetical protein